MDLGFLEGLRERLAGAGIGKPAVIGVVAVIVLVTVLATGRLSGAVTASEFAVTPAGSEQSETAGAAQVETEESSTVFVHVTGAVEQPGLCEVAAGSRVADAVQAAGGFSEQAVTDSVNLARVVQDGEQIHVASVEEATQAAQVPTAATEGAASAPGAGLVNINRASEDELVSLPGIGESIAARIVSDRQANGPYQTIEDLKRVSGVGDKKFEAIRDLICI